jgi:hypothetical protein
MLVCSALVCGCTATPAVKRIGSTPPAGAVVPLALERDMPIVELHAQDRKLRLIVDLGGADALALTEPSLASLNVGWTGGSKHVSDAFGRSTRSREFVLERARLGDLDLHGVRGYVIPESRLHQAGLPENLDGYVGHGLLGAMNLLVDYPQQRLMLVPREAPSPLDISECAHSAFEFKRVGVVSRIAIAGRTLTTVWDTGANRTVIRPHSVPPGLPRRTTQRNEIISVESVQIGEQDTGPLDLYLLDFSQPNVDVIMGNNFFAEHAVWFDFANERLAVEP